MTARILVVDDIPANVKLLEARLTAEYFDVVDRAFAAPRRWRSASAPQCDIVLLDVMMPEMDGFEVCRRLKANPVDAPHPGRHGDGARPAVRPRARAGGRRRRFPDQAGVRYRAARARALAGAAEDDDRRAAHARGHVARDRHQRSRSARRSPRPDAAGACCSSTTAASSYERIAAMLDRRAHRRRRDRIRRRRCSMRPKATTTA